MRPKLLNEQISYNKIKNRGLSFQSVRALADGTFLSAVPPVKGDAPQGGSIGESLFSYLGALEPEVFGRPIVIFTHRQADPDALCSALALVHYFQTTHDINGNLRSPKSVRIIAPQGSNLLGASVSKTLGINFDSEIADNEIEESGLIGAVDVGDASLLEPFTSQISKSKAVKILVDHHSSTARDSQGGEKSSLFGIFNHVFVNSEATSTCEIIAEGYPADALDERIARTLLVGLLFDSQHLGIATERTLGAAQTLLKSGARIDEAKEILRQRPERSEIIARFKAAQRLSYVEAGKYMLVQSEVSSFQAAIARMLVDIGADIAIAFGEHEEEVRISIRTTQKFFRETKVDMGIVLGTLSSEMAMTGGGHSTAASISGKAESPEQVVRRIVAEIRSRLELL